MIELVKGKRVQFDPETSLDELNKEYALAALDYFKNDKQKAADALKITKRTLDGWLTAWGISKNYYVNRLDIAYVEQCWRKHGKCTVKTARALRVNRARVYQLLWAHGLVGDLNAKNKSARENDSLPNGNSDAFKEVS
jgi:hypothetical protein